MGKQLWWYKSPPHHTAASANQRPTVLCEVNGVVVLERTEDGEVVAPEGLEGIAAYFEARGTPEALARRRLARELYADREPIAKRELYREWDEGRVPETLASYYEEKADRLLDLFPIEPDGKGGPLIEALRRISLECETEAMDCDCDPPGSGEACPRCEIAYLARTALASTKEQTDEV